MNRYSLAEKVAWQCISMPLEEAENFIRNNGFDVQIVGSMDELSSEPFIFLDAIILVVGDSGRIKTARIG